MPPKVPFTRCIWQLTPKKRCPQEAVYDGLCSVHIEYMEMSSDVQKELYNLLHSLLPHKEHADRVAEAIIRDVVGPALDRLAAREIANQDGYAERWRCTAKMYLKARGVETRLRSDFGELAKELKVIVSDLKDALGDKTPPALLDLHAWQATAEILADKELSDSLDEARKALIEDFGEVPRPEEEPKRCSCLTRMYDSKSCPLHGDDVK